MSDNGTRHPSRNSSISLNNSRYPFYKSCLGNSFNNCIPAYDIIEVVTVLLYFNLDTLLDAIILDNGNITIMLPDIYHCSLLFVAVHT